MEEHNSSGRDESFYATDTLADSVDTVPRILGSFSPPCRTAASSPHRSQCGGCFQWIQHSLRKPRRNRGNRKSQRCPHERPGANSMQIEMGFTDKRLQPTGTPFNPLKSLPPWILRPLPTPANLRPPGAYRVESNTFDEGSLEDVAFRNPDGSLVLLVLNATDSPMTFNIGWSGKFASYKLAGNAVATFRWNSPASAR